MQFGIVSNVALPAMWDECFPLISGVCNYNGNYDAPQDIYDLIINHRKYLWLAISDEKIIGLVITSIDSFPKKKVCSIDICTGENLESWIHNLPTIERWAIDNGCAEMFMMARPGYERKLKSLNYQKTHVFLQKEL